MVRCGGLFTSQWSMQWQLHYYSYYIVRLKVVNMVAMLLLLLYFDLFSFIQ